MPSLYYRSKNNVCPSLRKMVSYIEKGNLAFVEITKATLVILILFLCFYFIYSRIVKMDMDINISKVANAHKVKWMKLQSLLKEVSKRRELIKNPQVIPENKEDQVYMKINPLSKIIQSKILSNPTIPVQPSKDNNEQINDIKANKSRLISNEELILPHVTEKELGVNVPIGFYKLLLGNNNTSESDSVGNRSKLSVKTLREN